MNEEALTLDPARCALIVQDMQNDVVMDGEPQDFSKDPGWEANAIGMHCLTLYWGPLPVERVERRCRSEEAGSRIRGARRARDRDR